MTEETSRLDKLAAEFADDLTGLVRGVLGEDTPPFTALNMGTRVRVSPITDDETELRIPVSINGEPVLSLRARYFCCWDGSSTFLATDQADIHLHYADIPDPLIRFEYVRTSKEPPGAHIQVHAHRDEVAFLLRLADSGRPKQGFKRRKLPRLSAIHLPVGGHRMRPALEDVLLFLKREFAIDTEPGWRSVIDGRLRTWRQIQLMTAVRDAPEVAARALEAMGYKIGRPLPTQRGPLDDAPGDAKLYWP